MRRISAIGLLFGTALLCLGAQLAEAQGSRNITFNGQILTPDQQYRLELLERYYRVRLPDNRYWYDNRSGVMGLWNGPAVAVLPPGLGFGGPMPANCSGGGTRVFVNGRELHPLDVARLAQIMPVYPGRYWVDANGDFGIEHGPKLGNLIAISAPAQGDGQHRVYGPGELSGVIVKPAGACTNSGCYYPGQ